MLQRCPAFWVSFPWKILLHRNTNKRYGAVFSENEIWNGNIASPSQHCGRQCGAVTLWWGLSAVYSCRALLYSFCSFTSCRASGKCSSPEHRAQRTLVILEELLTHLTERFRLTTLAEVLQGLLVAFQMLVDGVALVVWLQTLQHV